MDPRQLVRDARATGDDSALRVYADWLEQQGDPERAQLVHFQNELERLGSLGQLGSWERRTLEVGWEIDRLLAMHGDRWRAELPSIDGVTWDRFERGFVCSVKVANIETLARSADAIAAAAPVWGAEIATLDNTPDPEIAWLRRLCVRDVLGEARLPLSVRELELDAGNNDLSWLGLHLKASLRELTINDSSTVGRELIDAIVERRWAKALASLQIPSRYVDDNSGYAEDPTLRAEDMPTLAKLVGLERLTIDRHRVGAPALRKLVAALPDLRALSARECRLDKVAFGEGAPLVELDLGRNAIGSTGVRAIATSPRCAELQRLVLDTCEIDSMGISLLIASPAWQTLRVLDLSRNPLGASAIRALGAAPPPAQLHTLALDDADLDEAAGTALGKVPWLGTLAVLALSGNMLGRGTAGLRAIVPDALRSLRISSIGLQRTEAAALARFWPHLVELDLSNNAITDAGLERFVTMREAAALQRLDLERCALTDDGLELLAGARCPRLRVLDLSGNRFGAALEGVLRSPFASQLEDLDLSRCALSAATIAMLAKTPMPPRLHTLKLRGNNLDAPSLVALAGSPTLRHVTKVALDGNPWTLPEPMRAQLDQRFGVGWHLHEAQNPTDA